MQKKARNSHLRNYTFRSYLPYSYLVGKQGVRMICAEMEMRTVKAARDLHPVI
jgi:hypothetical protein